MYIYDFWVELLPMFTDFQLVYLVLTIMTVVIMLGAIILAPMWLFFGSRGDRF